MPDTPQRDEVTPIALTAWQAAQLLGYTDRQFRALVEEVLDDDGHPLQPIDQTRHRKSWRWSRRKLESYVEGRWAA